MGGADAAVTNPLFHCPISPIHKKISPDVMHCGYWMLLITRDKKTTRFSVW